MNRKARPVVEGEHDKSWNDHGCTLICFFTQYFFKTRVQMHENKSFSSEWISNHCGVVIMFIHMYIPTATNHYDFVGTVTIISHIRKSTYMNLWNYE